MDYARMVNSKTNKIVYIAVFMVMIIAHFTAGTEVQYSDDNATWLDVDTIRETNEEAIQDYLEPEKLYYFRAKDNSTDWAYLSQWTDERGGNMWLFGVMVVPILLCFMFLYFANSIDDFHAPLKWFLRLLGLIMIFPSYVAGNIIINQNEKYASLEPVFNITAYGWIFWTVMAVFLVYVIYQIFMSMKYKKQNDFDLGRL